MNMRQLLAVAICAGVASSGFAQSDLSFDDLFPRKSYFGRGASGLEWSFDDRYLAYFWNPYDTRGGQDLWIYDAQIGSSKRMTKMEMFADFDREIPKAIERYKRDADEEARMLKLGDREYREAVQKKKDEDAARKEPLPAYGGVSQLNWAHKSHNYLFVYKGDIYRGSVGDEKVARLTQTRDAESGPEWTPNDDGFTFRRGDGVYLVKFDNSNIRQLNPELPNRMTMGGYGISPDGNKLMVTSSRTTGPDRQVDWISYRERFAQAQKTSRGVADDKFNQESYLFLYDLSDDPKDNPKNDGKPWEVWKYPGGEEYWYISINEKPWSPDGKKFTFATYKRDQRELVIYVADVEKKELKAVYKTNSEGDHSTPSLAAPFFTPDGNKLVALLGTSGYRHTWLIDIMNQGATQITKGDFETYPLRLSKDGKSLFVYSAKEDTARMNTYRVSMENGEFARIGEKSGNYGEPTISPNGKFMAATFGNWTTMSEMYVMSADGRGAEKRVTESHSDGFAKVNKMQPSLFSYKNRHGQTVHGYMFLPPGFKKEDKRPLFIYVYGGPLTDSYSVTDGSFNSSGYLFNMYLSYVHGYVTATIDPRGQSGYGEVFGKANWEAPGVAQVEDLSDGVKYLIDNYGVDSKKVGINGWSFGGFQTQMCMYTAPDVFTLGIAGAGPTEWQNYNTWYTGGVIGNSRDGKPEDLDKYSLTYLAKNLKSPLMLLHGVEDTNVLYQDTIKVYRKLLQYGLGSLVELVIDPTGGHGLGGDINNKDRHAIYLSFILRHWGSFTKPNGGN